MGLSPEVSIDELKARGWKALVDALGVSGAMRFLIVQGLGEGNYTEERRAIFKDMSVEDIIEDMKKGHNL